MIEMHADVWITLCGFDHRGVKRGASDRVDIFVRIAIVGQKCSSPDLSWIIRPRIGMACSQHFIGDPELFQRVNPACRERQIDRAPANDVPFARIGPPLVKIDFVSAPAEIGREQSARQSAADKNKFCHSPRIYESGTQESRKATGPDAWIPFHGV